MNRPAVFFDRDNTLISNDGYLGDPGRVVLISGAPRAIARARALGFAVVTVSNQSGVARGMFAEEAVHRVNSRMDELLLDQHPNARIDRHEFCPHHPEAAVERYKRDSDLRKPKPGMILQAAERLNLDLSRSWVVGDAPRDIEAGKAAGCRTILFTDPSLKPSSATEASSAVAPDFVANSLEHALDIIEQNQMSKAKPEPVATSENNIDDADAEAVVETTSATELKAAEPATKAAVAPVFDAIEASEPVASAPAEAILVETTVVEANAAELKVDSTESTSNDADTPASAPARAAPARRPTFADRVKAGTFQPARSVTASGAATVERPKRAALAVQESASGAPAATEAKAASIPVSALEPGVKPTEPVSDTELLEPLLQQILEELRMMRQLHPGTEFAVSKLLAGIVQVLVLPALFFAYLHRDSTGDLQSMLLLATFLQTLTIALLIMGRQQ